jgi:hypothetical protein
MESLWVLILIVMNHDPRNAATSSITFGSERACQAAGDMAKKAIVEAARHADVVYVCAPQKAGASQGATQSTSKMLRLTVSAHAPNNRLERAREPQSNKKYRECSRRSCGPLGGSSALSMNP